MKKALLYVFDKRSFDNVKDSIEENLPKWVEEYSDYKDKIYVLALGCGTEKHKDIIKELENSFEQEELENLKSEANAIKKKLAAKIKE